MRFCMAMVTACFLYPQIAFPQGLQGFSCSFAKDRWKPEDWIMVKSPRWDHMGTWVQEDQHILNQVPADATPEDLRGKRASESYTSMVLKRRFRGSLDIKVAMAFDDRMAPLLVLAPSLGEDGQGRPEYREHWEIVLYDRGINVWQHLWENDKPAWRKAAYWVFPVEAKTMHQLEVQVNRTPRGDMLVVRLGDREMGYLEASLPEEFHVGITACEGVNRFQSFTVAPR